MTEAVLIRRRTSDQGTFGELTVDGLTFATGELPADAAHPCIPTGEYDVQWQPSPRFGEKYTLQNVEGRTHILIHAGNCCGDVAKGLKSDVEGCILLGKSVGSLAGQEAVLQSGDAVKEFQDHMGEQPFRLRIIDEYAETGTPLATA